MGRPSRRGVGERRAAHNRVGSESVLNRRGVEEGLKYRAGLALGLGGVIEFSRGKIVAADYGLHFPRLRIEACERAIDGRNLVEVHFEGLLVIIGLDDFEDREVALFQEFRRRAAGPLRIRLRDVGLEVSEPDLRARRRGANDEAEYVLSGDEIAHPVRMGIVQEIGRGLVFEHVDELAAPTLAMPVLVGMEPAPDGPYGLALGD